MKILDQRLSLISNKSPNQNPILTLLSIFRSLLNAKKTFQFIKETWKHQLTQTKVSASAGSSPNSKEQVMEYHQYNYRLF